jgi:hypothetical protein
MDERDMEEEGKNRKKRGEIESYFYVCIVAYF